MIRERTLTSSSFTNQPQAQEHPAAKGPELVSNGFSRKCSSVTVNGNPVARKADPVYVGSIQGGGMRIKVWAIVIAVIGFSVFAFAQPKADAFDVNALNLTDGATPYQAISNWYKTATSVPFNQINNRVIEG